MRAAGWPRRSGSPTAPARGGRSPSGWSTAAPGSICASPTSTASSRTRRRRAYVRARGAQQYREVYDVIHPLQQMLEPRPLRTTPFYERKQALGAVFFEGRGWEQPRWYASNERLLERVPGARARRLGGAGVVADRRRRASGDAGAGRALRHDAVAEAGGERAGVAGLPRPDDDQPARQAGRERRLRADARRNGRHPQRRHGRPARPGALPDRLQRPARPGLA